MNKQQFIAWCASTQEENTQQSPLIMGVLNCTPDSFYDGGKYVTHDSAYDHAQAMIAAGADLIDIGGESSRPGAQSISVDEELDRVMPLIERLSAVHPITLSIDTCKPEVMQAAVNAGAGCINDICALQEEGALEVARACDVPICLMHMQGNPASMQSNPHYDGEVLTHINDFFKQRVDECTKAGIEKKRLILDPGFGFGKTTQHNLQLVKELRQFKTHGLPVMLGVSRKSTIGHILDQPPTGRLVGGLALSVYAMLSGVSMIRTHDVVETKQAFQVIQQLRASDRGI